MEPSQTRFLRDLVTRNKPFLRRRGLLPGKEGNGERKGKYKSVPKWETDQRVRGKNEFYTGLLKTLALSSAPVRANSLSMDQSPRMTRECGLGEMGDLRVEEIDEVADFKEGKTSGGERTHFNGRKIPTKQCTLRDKSAIFLSTNVWSGCGPRRKSRNIGDKK